MEKDSRIIAETDNYILFKSPINSYYPENNTGYMLNILEDILALGYRPLHYENRQQAFVCEKPGVRASIDKAA